MMSAESTGSAVDNANCPWCGMIHLNGICPKVKAYEYFPDGTLKRVEFHDPWASLSPSPVQPADPGYPWSPPYIVTGIGPGQTVCGSVVPYDDSVPATYTGGVSCSR